MSGWAPPGAAAAAPPQRMLWGVGAGCAAHPPSDSESERSDSDSDSGSSDPAAVPVKPIDAFLRRLGAGGAGEHHMSA